MAPQLDALRISLAHEGSVQCPQCESLEMHFDEVSIIDPGGHVVALHADGHEELSVVTAAVAGGQDSPQRHMIVLPHWCGGCGTHGEIVLRQQGGQTSSQYRETDVRVGEDQ